MIVYQCEDSLESILTAVYLAYEEKRDHRDTRISIGEQPFLFSEEHEVRADEEKALKVMRTLRQRFGEEDFLRLCYALTTMEEEKGQAVYQTIVKGLTYKTKPGHLFDALSDPFVHQAFALSRRAGNEVHHLIGFVRFQEWKGGILYGKIGPENNILPYLMEHFADRLPGESFILQDVNRKIAGLHPARREERGNKERKAGQGIWPTESSLTQGRESTWNRGEKTCGFERGEHLPVKGREQEKASSGFENEMGRSWYLASAEQIDEAVLDRMLSNGEREMAALFRYFCKNIAIKERKNLKLQQNLLPLRFQEYMTEFDKNR